MDATSFKNTMLQVHEAFEGGNFELALSSAEDLRQSLTAERSPIPEQQAWAAFYELKSLHALERWAALRHSMHELEPLMSAAGSTNHSYVCSLTMESCYELGDPEGVANWCYRCCELRLGHDEDSFAKAITSGRNLLEALEQVDRLVELLLQLSRLGIERGFASLALSGQTLAFEVASESGDPHLLDLAQQHLATHCKAFLAEMLNAPRAFERLSPYLEDEKTKALLDAGVRATLEHGSAMFESASSGDVRATMSILNEVGDPNLVDRFGRTALSAASFAGHRDLVHELLSLPEIDVDRGNVQSRTPLAQAADQGHLEILEGLLAAGADPDRSDFNDQTPLIIAAWQDHADVVRALARAGAKLELRDRTGNSALHLAATDDATNAVAALIEAGADIDARTELGHTPLMKAAMEGKLANVELLLSAGARADARDVYGLSACDWAEREGFPEVVARLATSTAS